MSKHGLTAAEVAEEGSVSLRTAYRDMDDLQLAGFPIYTEKEGKTTRWRFIDDYKFKIPEPFTLTELLCLHLGGDLLNVFRGTVFQESQQSILEKIRNMLLSFAKINPWSIHQNTSSYMPRLNAIIRNQLNLKQTISR